MQRRLIIMTCRRVTFSRSPQSSSSPSFRNLFHASTPSVSLLWTLTIALCFACSGGSEGSGRSQVQPGPAPAATTLIAGLSRPVFATSPPDDERIFIVDLGGTISVWENGSLTTFLDLSAKVLPGGEQGLLGMAFAPDYALSGLFYVYYIDLAGNSQLSRFGSTVDPSVADPTEDFLVNVTQPAYSNHKGGTVAFSPYDSMLYWALGDGGGGNDPDERAQDPNDLLGKMLRIDPGAAFGDPVTIPVDNPFAISRDPLDQVRDEIWGLGLRNPYRFSFDSETGDLFIADVGEQNREEINFESPQVRGGQNWGWDVREGRIAAPNPGDQSAPPWIYSSLVGLSGDQVRLFTDPLSFSDPIHNYGHTGGNCSITGGMVPRGPGTTLEGLYLFADFCSGRIWSLDPSPNSVSVIERTSEIFDTPLQFAIVAIGDDGYGAPLVVDQGGTIYRIGPTGNECDNGSDDDGDGLTDLADPGCQAVDDPSERDPRTACDDGFDNDMNGLIDFGDDPGCISVTDGSESSQPAFAVNVDPRLLCF